MSFDAAIYDILSTDPTLLATATGKVWLYSNLGKYGFVHSSPLLKEVVWDANGIMQPSVVVKSRSETPDFVIHDTVSQYASTRGLVEVWLYNNGDLPNTALQTMSDRIYSLLQDKNIASYGTCRLANKLDNFRDPSLEFALTWRRDFQLFGANKG